MILVLASIACHTPVHSEPDRDATSFEMPRPAPDQWARRLALIVYFHEPFVIEIPARGNSNQPLAVYVTTYSGGCIRDDTVVVSVSKGRAEIAPYQRIYATQAFEACTAELIVRRRRVEIVFPNRGQSIIRVTGRAQPGDTLVAVTRRIVIE